LVLAFAASRQVGIFGWIEAAAMRLDERKRTADFLIYLFIAAMYTLAVVAALRSLVSWADVLG
jgi:hypothetical protein